MDGMEDLLAELAGAGHAMHALSNYPIWYRMIDDKLRLSRFLRWSFVSCDTGLWKPDSAAFLHAARTLGVGPRACLFIDDRERNVDVARSVGMDAIHKTDADAVRDELRRRGVALGAPS
jgi:HAD superfamily hydrolase (TIGR01509 family)